jgi:hypothetical protein
LGEAYGNVYGNHIRAFEIDQHRGEVRQDMEISFVIMEVNCET